MTAHGMDIAVIMDLVHSHSVKNELEGLGNFDGTPYQYFHEGPRREHVAWDSLCFDYGKNEVLHFLLSNCKFWLDEYRFDGFRFDGVTSMLYYDHGLSRNFTNYGMYYDGQEDEDAITYLALANKLIKTGQSRGHYHCRRNERNARTWPLHLKTADMDLISGWPWVCPITGLKSLRNCLMKTGMFLNCIMN